MHLAKEYIVSHEIVNFCEADKHLLDQVMIIYIIIEALIYQEKLSYMGSDGESGRTQVHFKFANFSLI